MLDDEGDLVRRCLAGDQASLRAFVEQFQGAILGLCYRMLRHRQDAEDVAQDVFLRAFRNLGRWDPARPLKPWLFTIAANRCRTALTRRSRGPEFTDGAADQAAAPGNASAELGEELQLALDQIREEYRLCFILFYQQEMSCAEIGEVMSCPPGTVKTWLHRARHELANRLRRREGEEQVRHELHRI